MIENESNPIDYKTLFNLLWQHSDNLVLLISNDMNIKDINPCAMNVLNLKRENVVNKPINQLLSEWSIEPISLANVTKNIKKMITWCNNKKIAINWFFLPSLNAEHLLIGTIEIIPIDVPLQILQLENVLKFTPGLLYWKDINSIYLGCNDEFARLAGFVDRQEIKGKTDFDLIWKDRALSYVAIDKEVMTSGIAQLNYVEQIAVINKKTITGITNKVPMRDQNNQVIGIIGITTDITHQKEIELALSIAKEKAEAADQAKTEFIANMSHDIRTPLTGVIGMSKLLEKSVVDSRQKKYAHWLGESGAQLLHMLNDVLDIVSGDSANENHIHNENVNIREIIQNIVEIERPSTILSKIELITIVDDNVPNYIISDHIKLHRILLNLVGNAIKFTSMGYVTIHVTCLKSSKKHVVLQFKISDTGIGIPLEMQDKVFDRFFRITPSYKGIYTGHGVGLHIAQSYVHLLGSEIKLISKPDVGSTFYFDLSCKIGELKKIHSIHNNTKKYNINTQSKLLQNSDHSLSTSSTMKTMNPSMLCDMKVKPHILLIEDNPVALKVIENTVHEAGCRFTSCTDAKTALKMATTQHFDLILTDLGLPDSSGNELTKQIRDWEEACDKTPMPIIGLSAHARDRIKDECLQSGMNDAFSKPMDIQTFEAIKKRFIAITTCSKKKDATLSSSSLDNASKLGVDLPDRESELFELDKFSVFNEEEALRLIGGNRNLLISVLADFVETVIPKDIQLINEAHLNNDWDLIEKLAHKMKGGAVYLGTIKMRYACQYLERYHKAQHTMQLEPLYQQLIHVIKQTQDAIITWLDHQD